MKTEEQILSEIAERMERKHGHVAPVAATPVPVQQIGEPPAEEPSKTAVDPVPGRSLWQRVSRLWQ